MSTLRFTLFGSLRVVAGSGPDEIKLTRTVGLLLAYLLIERHRMHARELLTGMFWGDNSEERARHCLNTAIWRLRRSLELREPENCPYLLSAEGEVGFNQESDYWLDVAVFEDGLRQILRRPVSEVTPDDVARLENVLQLYTADLLEGVYEDWALRAREQERLLYLDGLLYLMHYYKHQQAYAQALDFGRRILQEEPLQEEVHREVMRLYVLNGQRALAVRQYEACQQILANELGIAPMEETVRLYRQIAAEAARPSSQAVTDDDSWQAVMQHLVLASRHSDLAREQVIQALQHAKRLLGRGA